MTWKIREEKPDETWNIVPPGTYIRVGYDPDYKNTMMFFCHADSPVKVVMPLSCALTKDFIEMLQSVVAMMEARDKLDS